MPLPENLLTQDQLNELLASREYPTITPDHIAAKIVKTEFSVHAGSTLTICVLTLENGFTVTGESACADARNFNAAIGEKVAFDNAKNKIWLLEGYLLRQALHLKSKVAE